MEKRTDRLLHDYLAEIGRIRRYSPQTVRAYGTDLEQFRAFCGRAFAGKVEKIAQAELVGRFLAESRRAGNSARTVARRASALRSFFRYLARRGLLADDVSDLFPSISLPRTIPRYLTAETMKRWVESMPEETVWDARDRALVLTFYASGARLSEITGLKWGGIDGCREQIAVIGKRQKERIIPIGKTCTKALTRYKERLAARFGPDITSGDTSVFLNQRGRPLHSRSVSRILNKHFAQISGGSTVHPHLLRHTCATHLVNNGANLMAIKELLGHESASTTQIYTHVSGDYLKKSYKRAFPRAEGDGK